MTVKVQIIMVVVLIAALALLLNMVRKRTLELKYILVWIMSGIILLLFVIFPQLMDHVARFFGIYSPVNMVFFLGFVLSVAIIFSLTVALSRLTARVRMLAQMIALEEDAKKETGTKE
ncbi:MAG: DUF2304 domain-containing protein [Eubacteriales bacterium]|nr:DUF2304 domain-containing protein [Eubacteriales bacterium]